MLAPRASSLPAVLVLVPLLVLVLVLVLVDGSSAAGWDGTAA